jgi:hypothetical protein
VKVKSNASLGVDAHIFIENPKYYEKNLNDKIVYVYSVGHDDLICIHRGMAK